MNKFSGFVNYKNYGMTPFFARMTPFFAPFFAPDRHVRRSLLAAVALAKELGEGVGG